MNPTLQSKCAICVHEALAFQVLGGNSLESSFWLPVQYHTHKPASYSENLWLAISFNFTFNKWRKRIWLWDTARFVWACRLKNTFYKISWKLPLPTGVLILSRIRSSCHSFTWLSVIWFSDTFPPELWSDSCDQWNHLAKINPWPASVQTLVRCTSKCTNLPTVLLRTPRLLVV